MFATPLNQISSLCLEGLILNKKYQFHLKSSFIPNIKQSVYPTVFNSIKIINH